MRIETEFPDDQLEELRKAFPGAQFGSEAGVPYFFLPGISLPNHCTPSEVDALLCPRELNGYHTRLFFSERISRPPHPDPRMILNWTEVRRIRERNWEVLSWQLGPDGTNRRLVQMVLGHLEAFQ